MDTESADQLSPESPVESTVESQKKSKTSYTRSFLLSFSELDICKKLPSGFDQSILSEFEDASNSILEQQRSLGGLSLQSSKRSDYGSLPPSRLESSGNYSRGGHGRWDTRSSGSSDKDGDLQSDQESFMQDSGRRSGNQSRHSWQHPEHDGLLGSGTFPGPSECARASMPSGWGNGKYQLKRSTEPYQPPRPYKAAPYSQNSTDSRNDETFGSTEGSSQDRSEEERKRRASFELMRKEQQKTLQEKQKQFPGDNKETRDADFLALLENSEDDKVIRSKTMSDNTVAPMHSQNVSSTSFHVQAPASRPHVPPGFASAQLEKNVGVQSSSCSLASEVGNAVLEDNVPLNGRVNNPENESHLAACMYSSLQKNDSKSTSVCLADPNQKFEIPFTGVEELKYSVGFENEPCKTSGLHEANESWEEDAINDFSNNKAARSEPTDIATQDNSASILEKQFGSALTKDGGGKPKFFQHKGVKADESTVSPAISESSKFAHWFLEEEKKPVEDFTSRELLSLIVSNEKAASRVSAINDKAIGRVPPSFPSENDETIQELLAVPATSSTRGIPELNYNGDKRDSTSVVLTCEDLEQSILAEVKDSSSPQHSVQRPWTLLDGKSQDRKAEVDDSASQHLLSLLQKGTDYRDLTSYPSLDIMGSSDMLSVTDKKASPTLGVADNTSAVNSETIHSSEKSLTLEALFGTAFMNDLQSVGAPVSVQRGSVGRSVTSDVPQPQELQFPRADDGFFTSREYQSNKTIHEDNTRALNHTQEARAYRTPGPWLSFQDSPVEGVKLGNVSFEEGEVDIHLPEEESLITVADSVNPLTSETSPFRNLNRDLIPSTLLERNNKSLNDILIGDESFRIPGRGGPPHLHGSPDLVDSDHLHHLHGRLSSHDPHHQVNHMRHLFPQLDHHARRNHQVISVGPEGIHHDPYHPFPANFIPQHAFLSPGGPRFDPAVHHPMLQHMAIPGNFQPHHPLHGLPIDNGQQSQTMNHMSSYIHEMDSVHSFPFNHRQPNYGGLGMGMPGSGVRGGGVNHLETLDMLIEMELRANSKQIHPAAAAHIHGNYGAQLDMGFRYR